MSLRRTRTMSTFLKLAMMTCLVTWFRLAVRGANLKCGGLFVLDREDMTIILTSPGYPGVYPKLTQCQWTIVSTLNKRLAVEFTDFSLGGWSPCRYDKLMVDTDSCEFVDPITLCGDTSPRAIESVGKIICLRFLSDVVVNQRGFHLKVSLVDESQLLPPPSLQRFLHETRNIPKTRSLPCDLFPLVVTSNVTITSPNFGPGKLYPPNTICRWLLYLDVLHKAVLRFTAFDLENHCACEPDNVQIFSGEKAKPDLGFKLCGPTIPKPIILTEPVLLVFSSDGMAQGQGFSAFLEFVLLNTSDNGTAETLHPHYLNDSRINVKPSTTSTLNDSRINVKPSTTSTLNDSRINVKPSTTSTSLRTSRLYASSTSPSLTITNIFPKKSSSTAPIVSSTLIKLVSMTTSLAAEEVGLRTSSATRQSEAIKESLHPQSLQLTAEVYTSKTTTTTHDRSNNGQRYTSDLIPRTTLSETVTSMYSASTDVDMSLINPSPTSSSYIPFTAAPNDINNNAVNDSIIGQSTIVDICQQTHYKLSSQRVVFQSPGFGTGVYPVNTRCDIVIAAADPSMSLSVTFLDMDMEPSQDCGRDWLEVAARSGSLGKFCGSRASNFLVRDNMMMMTFLSGSIVTGSGFRLQVEVSEGDIGDAPKPQELAEIVMCDSIFETVGRDAAVVTSRGYPRGLYPLDKSCDLKLFSGGESLTFEVTADDMDIEESTACTFDYLVIYDGVTPSSSPLARMCGAQIGQVITTSGPNFRIQFSSNQFIAKRGFKLTVRPQYGTAGILTAEPSIKPSPAHAPSVPVSTSYAMTPSAENEGLGDTLAAVIRDASLLTSSSTVPYILNALPSTFLDMFTSSPVSSYLRKSTTYYPMLFSSTSETYFQDTTSETYFQDTTSETYFQDTHLRDQKLLTITETTRVTVSTEEEVLSPLKINATITSIRLSTFVDKTFKPTADGIENSIQATRTNILTVDYDTSSAAIYTGTKQATIDESDSILSVVDGSVKAKMTSSEIPSSTTATSSTYSLDAHLPTTKLATPNAAAATPSASSPALFLGSSYPASTSVEKFPVLTSLTSASTPSVTMTIPESRDQPDLTFAKSNTSSASTPSPTLEPACFDSPSILRQKSGLIASPGFHQHQPYPNDLACQWIIEGGRGRNISVQFLNFSLEPHTACSYDFLELYNVVGVSLKLVGRYCGGLLPGNFTTSGEALIVKFVSDRMGTFAGFLMAYDVYDIVGNQSQCPIGRTSCHDNTLCVPTEWLCDGEEDCPLGDDEEQCYTCSNNEFACTEHSCIPLSYVCDGIPNCNHGDDENDCVNISVAVNISDAVNISVAVNISDSNVLLIRKEGTWHPVCADWDLLLTDSLLQWACTQAGHGDLLSAHDVPVLSPFYILLPSDGNVSLTENNKKNVTDLLRGRISSVCSGNKVISLRCSPRECGLVDAHLPQPYILGSFSVDGQWPWTVALYSGSDFRCGATLVSRHWLVTAGHCVYNLLNSPHTTTARVGHVNMQSPDLVVRRVSEVILHPQNNYIYENDIGLVRLEGPVDASPNQRPICLDALPRDWNPNSLCYIAGWGVTDKTKIANPQMSTILHHAKVKIWERSKCELSYPGQIKQSMFCAGYHNGEMDACKGDSGGPLMCLSRHNQWQLVGVVSWGEGCGQIGKPGVYTKVDSYLDWISLTTNEEVNYGVSCDFEHQNICGYSGQSGNAFMWTRRAGGISSIAKPYNDNTLKNESGHYMYTYTPYGMYYMTTILTTPPLPVSDVGYCLLASTVFHGCYECKFEVRTTDNSGNQSQTRFRLASDAVSGWMRFEIDLPADTHQINFLSTSGRQSNGGIGLDDVMLDMGPCAGSKLLNCNFSNSNSSETLCGYKQDTTDDFNWVLSQDSADTNTSRQQLVGSFLRAQHIFGYPGDRARIISPTLKTTISMCFSFMFRMSSASAGSLNVCKRVYFSGSTSMDCSLWSTSSWRNLQPNVWTSAKVKLPALNLEFSVALEMNQGADQGYIDVDNLNRLDGDCL